MVAVDHHFAPIYFPSYFDQRHFQKRLTWRISIIGSVRCLVGNLSRSKERKEGRKDLKDRKELCYVDDEQRERKRTEGVTEGNLIIARRVLPSDGGAIHEVEGGF